MKICSTMCFLPSLLQPCFQLLSRLSFAQLIPINDLHLRLTQTPCLEKSGSTPLRKNEPQNIVIDSVDKGKGVKEKCQGQGQFLFLFLFFYINIAL